MSAKAWPNITRERDGPLVRWDPDVHSDGVRPTLISRLFGGS